MATVQSQHIYSFLLERPPTPIYERITKAIKNALENLGHRVIYFEPSRFETYEDACKYLLEVRNNHLLDYCLVTSNSTFLQSHFSKDERRIFEIIEVPIIFLHHDHIAGSFSRGRGFSSNLTSFLNIKDNCWHFCLESKNIIDLRLMGFERVYPIFHGSDFCKPAPFIKNQDVYNVSFVGHVVPGIEKLFNENEFFKLPYSHWITADFWSRLVRLDEKMEPSATTYASNITRSGSQDFFEIKFLYQYALSILSVGFRGELIKRLNEVEIDIIGGDPGYLREGTSNRKIEKPSVKYHLPTKNYAEAEYIYATSKINLNITALQFDEAVVNRVIDVGASGGFLLTDWKPELLNVTSVHEEISYKTVEELNDKINYYLSHEKERLEIAEQLHKDVISRYTYENIVKYILSKLSIMPNSHPQPLRIDLGCGAWKPEGFIGVDIQDREGVDIVANLKQPFPFPDNSVDYLRAHDVIEHLPDKIHTMNEIWRVCKPEAIVDISVPSTDSRAAFQDPTHVSYWNINSFQYYCREFPPYLELCRSYGFKGEFSIIQLEQKGSIDNSILVRAILKVSKKEKTEERSLKELIEILNLREINTVVCVDWRLSEATIYEFLLNVIKCLGTHPDRQKMTLLVDTINTQNNSQVSPEEMISEIAIYLVLEESLDVLNEGLEISLLPDLSEKEKETLAGKIKCRIYWESEKTEIIKVLGMGSLPCWDLESLRSKRVIQLDEQTWDLR